MGLASWGWQFSTLTAFQHILLLEISKESGYLATSIVIVCEKKRAYGLWTRSKAVCALWILPPWTHERLAVSLWMDLVYLLFLDAPQVQSLPRKQSWRTGVIVSWFIITTCPSGYLFAQQAWAFGMVRQVRSYWTFLKLGPQELVTHKLCAWRSDLAVLEELGITRVQSASSHMQCRCSSPLSFHFRPGQLYVQHRLCVLPLDWLPPTYLLSGQSCSLGYKCTRANLSPLECWDIFLPFLRFSFCWFLSATSCSSRNPPTYHQSFLFQLLSFCYIILFSLFIPFRLRHYSAH